MNRHFLRKGLALLCGILLIATTLLSGCASEPAEEGHNHETPAATTGTSQAPTDPAEKGHNHKKPTAVNIEYAATGDKYTLTIKDCKDNTLFTKEGLTQKGLSETISDSVFSISWVLNNNPGGYETIYIDRLNCRVSDVISGEQATDGTRLLYAVEKDGAVTAVVCDLFDKDGFRQETPLSDAYTKGDYVVLGARLVKDHNATVTYLTDAEGGRRSVVCDLYPDGKPTEETKKTEKTEKTKKTEK